MISIIVRTKNEEKWITQCLQAIKDQSIQDFEIVIVDNKSTDKTLEKAKVFDSIVSKIVNMDRYMPGESLNIGIREAKGEYIVCISAHCIPTNKFWLENLLKNFEDKEVAGVYGRQEPLSFSSDFDKRDLMIVFGLDKKVQRKDSFFHNANSMLRRDLWEKYPFDENTTNIEDRIWAAQVLKDGYKIVYEPEASVYHYHGIHQNRNEERCFNVVRIMEELKKDGGSKAIHPKDNNIVVIIPVMGDSVRWQEKYLLEYALEHAKSSHYVRKIYVSTDSELNIEIARKYNVDVIKRDESLSKDYIGLEQVLQYSLEKIEKISEIPDIVVVLEETFPNRPKHLIDNMLEELLEKGFDSILSAKKEYKLRSGNLLSGNVGIFEITNEEAVIEVK